MGLLNGKVAIVTGAGGGLGRAHALELAHEGAAVVVNDLGGAVDGTGGGDRTADVVVNEIKAAGGRAVADYGSVTSEADAQAMVDLACSEFGKLDILINNAGILRDKSFKNMDEQMWDGVVDVHLKGTYYATKAAYQKLLDQEQGGRIIMTSSTSGLIGNFGQANYGAAKAGIAGFMRCLALEGKKANITVNVLVPNAYSRMTKDLFPEDADVNFAPEKVSPAATWLCSDEAADITGRQFAVSGNRVTLLYPAAFTIASREHGEKPWSVDEIGNLIRQSVEEWPESAQTEKVLF